MSNLALRRVKREFKEVITSSESSLVGIQLQMIDDRDFMHLRGEISGPPDTAYASGKFLLDIKVPDSYPFHPPQIKFTTRIWHPNISSQTGTICLDILKDEWAASMTLRTVLLSLQALLCVPEPNDPLDAVVAEQFISNQKLFKETATFWAQVFANAPGRPSADFKEKIKHLQEKGVSWDQALSALSCCGWDLGRATDNLFSENSDEYWWDDFM